MAKKLTEKPPIRAKKFSGQTPFSLQVRRSIFRPKPSFHYPDILSKNIHP
jgi:hypothetical protein